LIRGWVKIERGRSGGIVTRFVTANLFHGSAAVVVIATGIDHIYLGTIGIEVALNGMTHGEVYENRARESHNLWPTGYADRWCSV
jgi:formate dehydrogenase subunit gamma